MYVHALPHVRESKVRPHHGHLARTPWLRRLTRPMFGAGCCACALRRHSCSTDVTCFAWSHVNPCVQCADTVPPCAPADVCLGGISGFALGVKRKTTLGASLASWADHHVFGRSYPCSLACADARRYGECICFLSTRLTPQAVKVWQLAEHDKSLLQYFQNYNPGRIWASAGDPVFERVHAQTIANSCVVRPPLLGSLGCSRGGPDGALLECPVGGRSGFCGRVCLRSGLCVWRFRSSAAGAKVLSVICVGARRPALPTSRPCAPRAGT